MKKTIQSLLALVAFGASGLLAQAQPAPKIYVVDMAKLLDGHYKTEEQIAKLRSDQQKAEEEIDKLNKEGNSLVEKYKELVDQSNNPAATSEAKAKAQGESQKMLEEIQRKQREVQSFQINTRNSLQQRMETFKSLILDEISKVAVDIAKRHGATLLLDKSGPSLLGVPSVLYADPAYDLTEEVAKEINKDRPPPAPAATATPASAAGQPAATPAAPAGDTPKITVPGVSPK